MAVSQLAKGAERVSTGPHILDVGPTFLQSFAEFGGKQTQLGLFQETNACPSLNLPSLFI